MLSCLYRGVGVGWGGGGWILDQQYQSAVICKPLRVWKALCSYLFPSFLLVTFGRVNQLDESNSKLTLSITVKFTLDKCLLFVCSITQLHSYVNCLLTNLNFKWVLSSVTQIPASDTYVFEISTECSTTTCFPKANVKPIQWNRETHTSQLFGICWRSTWWWFLMKYVNPEFALNCNKLLLTCIDWLVPY